MLYWNSNTHVKGESKSHYVIHLFILIWLLKKKKMSENLNTRSSFTRSSFFFSWLCILYLLISATISCDI